MSQGLIPMRGSHVLRGVLLIVPMLLASLPALAASREARERAARKACLAGDANKGVEILAELFVVTNDSTYIFNQGRCYEQNRRYEEAAARFEEYLRTPNRRLRDDDRAAAEKHIADCNEKLKKERENSPAPVMPLVTPAPAPQPTLAPTPLPPEAATAAVARPTAPPVQGPRRWGLITAGIITSTVGVAGIVTGLVFNLKANNAVKEMETELGAYSTGRVSDQENYKTAAWIGYGAGAACALAGAVLIGVGSVRSRHGSSATVAFVPALTPDHVGAVLTGGF